MPKKKICHFIMASFQIKENRNFEDVVMHQGVLNLGVYFSSLMKTTSASHLHSMQFQTSNLYSSVLIVLHFRRGKKQRTRTSQHTKPQGADGKQQKQLSFATACKTIGIVPWTQVHFSAFIVVSEQKLPKKRRRRVQWTDDDTFF